MKNKAFTLVELLVVIAVISLLSSIIFSSVSTAREKAAIAKNQFQGQQIKKAIGISADSLLVSAGAQIDPFDPFQTNTDITPISQNEELAAVIFPEIIGYDSTPGTGTQEGSSTELGDHLPRVPAPIPADPDGNREYYYFGNGERACISAECINIKCGPEEMMGSSSVGAVLDEYIVAYKIADSGSDGTRYSAVGYDPDKQLFVDIGSTWYHTDNFNGSGDHDIIYDNNAFWQCV